MAAAIEQEGGYASTSVNDVLACGSLSAATFYNHFASKRECFDATYAHVENLLFERIDAACELEAEPPQRVHAALVAALDCLADRPGFARVFAVEPAAVGEGALERQAETVSWLAKRLRAVRGEGHGQLPELTEVGRVGGALLTVGARAQAPDAGSLAELRPILAEALLASYIGAEQAKALAGREPPLPVAPLTKGSSAPSLSAGRGGEPLRYEPPSPLPSGRAAPPPEVTAASHRERLLTAVAVTTAERGYAKTTVGEIASRARVSRKALYAVFPGGKQECFAAAYDHYAQQLYDALSSGRAPGTGLRQCVEAAISLALDRFAAQPYVARLLTVEAAAGPVALDWHYHWLDRFAALLRDAAGSDGPSAASAWGALAAASALVSRQLLASGPQGLSELTPQLVAVLLAPYGGPGAVPA